MVKSVFRRDQWVLLSLLACSLGLNLYLAVQVKATVGRVSPAQFVGGLSKGEEIGPIRVQAASGTDLIELRGAPTVVYFFQPQCPWCRRNEKATSSLHARAADRFRFIAISLSDDGFSEYATGGRIPFPAYVLPVGDYALRGRIGGVPATIAVSSTGRILEIWSGAFVGETKKAVEKFFGASIEMPLAGT